MKQPMLCANCKHEWISERPDFEEECPKCGDVMIFAIEAAVEMKGSGEVLRSQTKQEIIADHEPAN